MVKHDLFRVGAPWRDRDDAAKELEILVPHRQAAVLRRQVKRSSIGRRPLCQGLLKGVIIRTGFVTWADAQPAIGHPVQACGVPSCLSDFLPGGRLAIPAGRIDAAKDLEILMLSREAAVQRRQAGRPR